MSFLIADRVKETSTSTGTGAFTLAGAVTGFQTFASGVGDGNGTFYAITDGIDWEIGSGTYFSSGTSLNRDTVLSSSNSGNKVNWGAGEKTVFVTYPASQAKYEFPPNVATPTSVTATGVVGGGFFVNEAPVDFLIVAGGAGGGTGASGYAGGGGGAGGLRTSFGSISGGGGSPETTFSALLNTSYTVTVGAGGATNTSGSSSVFNLISTTGGGVGGGGNATPYEGSSGGSGGGGGTYNTSTPVTNPGGAGTTNEGYAGGVGYNRNGVSANIASGGGGGAGGAGTDATAGVGGDGGDSLASSITGTSTYYAGGGGGGAYNGTIGVGGLNSGGNGARYTSPALADTPGVANTGGGGGGDTATGSSGGSGVVILRYPDGFTMTNTGGGLTFTTDSSSVPGYKITTFTAGTGSIEFTS